MILGLVIFIMDLRYPRKIATFFGVDVLQDDDIVMDSKVSKYNSNVRNYCF